MLKQSLSILRAKACTKSQDATDLLHEDLVMVEQRVEPAKKAAQVIHKKLQGCLHGHQGLDTDKRMKRLPLMMLSTSMAESLNNFDDQSSIRHVLEVCCVTEQKLASVQADFELKVEKDVLEPLSKLCEEDLPDIIRNRRQFAKLTTDWQNACNRCQGSTAPQAKQDGLREDAEEARRKLDNIKDQYSADLYHFATKEDDYANYFIRLLERQAEYHKSSHDVLHHCISEIKENKDNKEPQSFVSDKKVFGEPLLSHLSQSGTEIAVPILECVQMLLNTGMREEGLFRLAAAASVVKRLKASLNGGTVDHSEFCMEPHAVAGVLKCYLRELPEPLMTFDLYKEWFQAAGEKELTDKLEKFKVLLKKLPPENYNNLRYLVQFLSLLSEQQSVNRMSPSNIAIVLGPNLLWPLTEEEITLSDMASASSVQVVTVMEPLIQHCSSLFPEEVSFEIPELPENPILFQPVTVSESPMPENTKVRRTSSSSSISSSTSSCSSHHHPLSKANSTTSQDSMGFFLVKSSGSMSRSGVTTWDNPESDPAVPTCPDQTATNPSSQPLPSDPLVSNPSTNGSSTAAQNPTPAPRAAKKLSVDLGQLGSISEAPTQSPNATVNRIPLKPSRSFSQRPVLPVGDQVPGQRPRAPAPPKPQVPPPPRTTAAQKADTKTQVEASPGPPAVPPPPPRKNPPIRRQPGVRPSAPPPPLPPPPVPKQVPSAVQ